MVLPEKMKATSIQGVAVAAGSILLFNFGLIFGSTPAHSKLYESEATPLKHVVDEAVESWISGILFLSAAFGAFSAGFLASKIGPKHLLTFTGLFQLLGWTSIHFGSDILHVYLSRLFAGLAAGSTFVALPIFIIEIAEPLKSSHFLVAIEAWRAFGICLGFICSIYVPYSLVPIIGLITSCVFNLVFPSIRESHLFYLRQKDEKNMEKSLRWYRGIRQPDDQYKKSFVEELNELRNQLNGVKQADIYDIPRVHFWKLLLITTVLAGSIQLCGVYAILNDIDEEFGMIYGSVLVSTESGSLLLAASQVIAAYLSAFIIPKVARKVLLVICSGICALAAMIMAIFWKHSEERSVDSELYWYLMLALLSLYVVAAQLGLQPLSTLIISELACEKWRNKIFSISTTISLLLVFCQVKYFIYINILLGVKFWLWFFAAIGAFIALFSLIFVPETKDKSLNEIQEALGLQPQSEVAKANTIVHGSLRSEYI